MAELASSVGSGAAASMLSRKPVRRLSTARYLAKFVVRTAQKRQCILHLSECLCGLHHISPCDLARQQARCLNDEREDNRSLADGEVEALEFERAIDNGPEVVYYAGKACQQVPAFDFFTAKEGDTLTVFAQADQCVTEVCVELWPGDIATHVKRSRS